MKVYLQGGILSISRMRKHFNQLEEGGGLSSAEKEQIKHQIPVVQAITDYYLKKYPPRNYVERSEYSLPFNKERLAILNGTMYVESYLSPYTNQGDNFKEAVIPHKYKDNLLGSGLIQHSGARKKALLEYMKKHSENSVLQNNLEFIDQEYNAKPGHGAAWLRRGNSLSGQRAKEEFESITSRKELNKGTRLLNDYFIAPAEETAKMPKREAATEYLYDDILDSVMTNSWLKQAAEKVNLSTFLK